MVKEMKSILSEAEAVNAIQEYRKDGGKVVTTNGTFDILHLGHVKVLEQAKSEGDVLIVLLNSDISVRENKGPKRPIVPQDERAKMLLALRCVDYVMIFDDKEVADLLSRLKPDIHAKGGTYIPERVRKEQEVMESFGGEWVHFDELPGHSTTNLIDKVLEVYGK